MNLREKGEFVRGKNPGQGCLWPEILFFDPSLAGSNESWSASSRMQVIITSRMIGRKDDARPESSFVG
jgi:hypothetical protein